MGDIVDTLAALGVPDVVATRWQIDSGSAVPMMDAFYGGLAKGLHGSAGLDDGAANPDPRPALPPSLLLGWPITRPAPGDRI